MKLILMSLFLVSCLNAQVHRIIEYTVDGTDHVQRLTALIQIPGVKVIADPVLGLVSIWAENEEKAGAAEAQFRKFFKPKAPISTERNVEVSLHVLYAKQEGNEMTEVPAILQPVVQQLKQVTLLSSFRSVETQILRIRSGKRIESSGVLTWSDVPDNVTPLLQFKAEVNATGTQIFLENLNFGVRVPNKVGENQFQYREVGITTSLDLKPGQLVVVGKTNVSPKEGALVLVLSAKLVD